MSEGYLVALLLCTSAELVGRTEENANRSYPWLNRLARGQPRSILSPIACVDASSVASLAVSIMQVLAVGAVARQCGMRSLLKHSLDQVQRLAILEDVRLLR